MSLAHSRRGSGPPLIVIQQLDPAAFWAPVIDALAGDFELVAVDLPGFGDSPPLEGPPSVAALTEAVAAWIPAAGLTGAPVVGNSLGGAVAIELAKRGAVSGAVAISPVGFWTEREAAKVLRALRAGGAFARAVASRPGLITRTRPGRTMAFGQLVARPAEMPEPTARAALRSMATSPGFEATRRELLSYRLEGPEPTVPVTIAWAAKDRMTPPHQAERARDLLPGARIITLDGCGHAAMVDDPALVARVVREATATA
jgi:pimeloyl-ACP methyl ester carboxylesterase